MKTKEEIKRFQEMNPDFDWMNYSHLILLDEEVEKIDPVEYDPGVTIRMVIGIIIGILLLIILGITQAFGQTKPEVYDYILSTDIKHPQIVYQQVLKETGHLQCDKCSMRYNNLFGFWNGSEYLKFDRWEDSVDYYERWQIRKGYDGGDYYEFLINKWGAKDMNHYISTLKRVKI